MTTYKKTVLAVAAAIMFLGAAVASAQAATRTDIKQMVIEEAMNSNVPPALALAVAKVESDFQDRALSTAGARGVMQIMPQTGRGVFGVHEDELWNARLNIQLGLDYLQQLHDQYGGRWDLALSHYNGGTLKGGKGANAVPHAYTRKYVADVMQWWKRYADQSEVWQTTQMARVDGNDGWRPARTTTRAYDTTGLSAPMDDLSGIPTQTHSRRVPDGITYGRVDVASDLDQPDFAARLVRARRTLDDFAPVVRWTPGQNG